MVYPEWPDRNGFLSLYLGGKMIKHRVVHRKYFSLLLATIILVSLACGSSTTEKLQEAVSPTVTATEEVVVPTQEQAEDSGEAAGGEPSTDPKPTDPPPTVPPPTETPLPTEPPPTPTPEPEPITVTKVGFGQDGQQVGFAFIVENPNPGLAFESSQYQLAAYDEAGIVLETDSGYISLLLPGQSLGFGGELYVDDGVTVSSIEVQLNAGDPERTDPLPTFTSESTAYYPGDYSSSVTGVVSSPYDRDFTDLRVSAVVYDEAGEIIGGGYTYLDFILANTSTGTAVSVNSAGDVASVELHPAISGLSLLSSDEGIPDDASEIQLVNYGFGQDGRQAGFGMLIANPNDDYSVESTQYHLTAFSADGTVLGVDEGYVNVLLPEQTLGVGGDLYFEEGMEIDHVEVQIKAGEYVESDPIPLFTSENATYQSGSYSSEVTGLIVSPYNTDITSLRVSAIAYNEAGEIIGGGYTYLDFAPSNDKAAVEVSVTTAGTPATVELYAAVSSLSDFE